MPKLEIVKDGDPQREEIIESENTIIGRAHDCDIIIEDEAVSRRHLRIICILGDCFLEDLNSANGTLVNSRLTTKCPLEYGDVISIGHHKISYKSSQSAGTSDEEFDRTRIQLIKQLSKPEETEPGMEQAEITYTNPEHQDTTVVARPDNETTQESEQEIPPPQEPESETVPEPTISRKKAENPKERIGNLVIVSGKREGHTMALNKSVTSIDKVGQRVAAITRRPDGYFLVPLGDGTPDNIKIMVNGEEINRKIYPLWSNDIIDLGGTEMEFLFTD